jgi:hypothetical protein
MSSLRLIVGLVTLVGLAPSARAAAHLRPWEKQPLWSLELRLGPHRPQLTTSPAAKAIENRVYWETDKSLFKGRPMQLGVEGDLYLYNQQGLGGLYGRVGYWSVSAKSRLCLDGAGEAIQCTSETIMDAGFGNDKAAINVMPLSLGLVYRADQLRRSTKVPVVFNFKAGLDYHVWWATLGDATTEYRDEKARGGTLGYSLAAGISVALDAFSNAMSAGRNDTRNFLFVEYNLVRGAALAGKNKANRLDFTDNRLIVAGLAIDFL